MIIKINEEYKKLLPSLPREEYYALKESVRQDGLHFPIIINEESVILDGHNRFEICNELGMEPKFEERNFENPLLEKRFVIESNLKRRHLTTFQKVEMALPLLEIEKELAKERMLNGTLASNGTRGKATENVAKTVGVSTRTLERAKKIIEKGSEELKERVRRGKTSITYAYKKVRRKEKHRNPPPLPKEKFDVIYADPPWQYEVPLRGDPELHYQTMPLQDICNLEVPIHNNAILFLWVTNPQLEQALKVLKAWGFKYKTNLVWVKDKIGTGYYFRGQHELLLVAKRGEIPAPSEENRPSSVLISPRKKHSEKPHSVYEMIERMYPKRKYLELFARNGRKGWQSWGIDLQ